VSKNKFLLSYSYLFWRPFLSEHSAVPVTNSATRARPTVIV